MKVREEDSWLLLYYERARAEVDAVRRSRAHLLLGTWLMDLVPVQCFMLAPIRHVLLSFRWLRLADFWQPRSFLSVSLRVVSDPAPSLRSAHWHPDRNAKVTDESGEH